MLEENLVGEWTTLWIFFYIGKGVRQGCILSPHLEHQQHLVRCIDIGDMGIQLEGKNLTDLRYADDTALLSDIVTSIERFLLKVGAAGGKSGFKLYVKNITY
ncbi:retrovirus-related Pol polyprotein from type-1 retrotransposable element R2 [Elysia marginata]|uniref:Retrovirus-related Pol polyprotein from type-1 retrotransposable element R2 n=1 Tax=Elysia marginata TaxID=1093978 RepID=A0AAV4H4G9_9GAST|nr:retrovirus-related Pol polyprotein from type-1 retrotransposable element R2 [Elysia marginata]